MARNPIKDKVAIVGLGSTGFARDSSGQTQAALALRARRYGIPDAGLTKGEVDGVVGTALPAPYIVNGLGLSEVTYYTTEVTPFGSTAIQAANAVFSGACEVAVAYHAVYRAPATSRSAARDPFRRMKAGGGGVRRDPEFVDGGVAYTAWASRYLHETRAKREHLGFIAAVDLYYPYDGFSFITLSWFQNAGWCKRGEAGEFIRQNWDAPANRILINGRIPVNTHGGALSEGATQGSGHIREAVSQLRGTPCER